MVASLWAAWAAAFAAAAAGLSMPKWSQIALTLSSFLACFTWPPFLPMRTIIASIVAIGASFTLRTPAQKHGGIIGCGVMDAM